MFEPSRAELDVAAAITRLKAAYFRLMDAHDWDAWGNVLSEDCEMSLGGDPPVVLRGRQAIVESAERNLGDRVGVHLGHMPEISLLEEDTASGRWSLLAYSTVRPQPGQLAPPGMLSFGRYVDTYRREGDGAWRISTTELSTVLRVVADATAATTLAPTDGVVVVA